MPSITKATAHAHFTMDEAYQQYSHHGRKNRSSTNLNHLTLAPLVTKLPLDDEAYAVRDLPPPRHTTSYLQGKSAPSTPGLLTRSPEHSRTRNPDRRGSVPNSAVLLSKSKSASYLAASDHKPQSRKTIASSGTTSPHRQRKTVDWDATTHHQDGDWLLRAGVLISSEAREYKGQMWLNSRASSTSLVGMRDADEELFEREIARERELALRNNGSRRGSAGGDGLEGAGPPHRSARASRAGSRQVSRVNSRSQLLTPLDAGRFSEDGGYFARLPEADDYPEGPDFVNLDEKLEAIEQDTSQEDELAVRKLVRGERAGSWFSWPLFSVEEQEDSDLDGEDEGDASTMEAQGRRGSSVRHFEGVTNAPKEQIPPPDPQQGGWQDAAWLLTVASKVIL